MPLTQFICKCEDYVENAKSRFTTHKLIYYQQILLMVLLSDSTQESKPDMHEKSSRQVCWDSRDKFFACLDRHGIEDAIKDGKSASAKCNNEELEFEQNCIKSWVSVCKWFMVNTYSNKFILRSPISNKGGSMILNAPSN